MAIIYDTLETTSIKVDYPDLNGGGRRPLFGMWVECPASAPDKDLTSARALLPTDVPMVAVPSELAAFVGNQVPRIEIRHHGLGNDGAADVWVSTTCLMTVAHVMNIFSRMLWLGEGAGSLPVFRSMLSTDECSRLWSAACAQGLVITKREDVRDTRKALEHFSQQVYGSEEFEAKQVASRGMFLIKGRLDVADADAETAEACRVKAVQDMRMDHLVEPGASMAVVADLWEFVGPPGDDDQKVGSTGMLQKIIHPVLSTMPNLTKADASITALERAQKDDDTIAIEAILDRFKQALKPFEYREYSQSSKGRLLEWCALVDLDNASSSAKGGGFHHAHSYHAEGGVGPRAAVCWRKEGHHYSSALQVVG